jgi:integrase
MHAEPFNCPTCNGRYRIVRAEADAKSFSGTIECYYCGGPLVGRDGKFVLIYFVADKPRQRRPDNPFSRIKPYHTGTHHTWTDIEIAAYEAAWPIGTRERLAFDLLLYTAQRIGDVARMRRSDLRKSDDGHDEIHITQEKTGIPIIIPVHENLLRSLKATLAKGLTLIGSPHGRPMTARGVGELVSRAARAAGLSEKCVPHGLRKAALTRLANNNATTKEIQAVGGHRSLREVERYTARADQRRLARSAIARLPRENSTEQCQTAPSLTIPNH